jgi:putative cell wall-binding protein
MFRTRSRTSAGVTLTVVVTAIVALLTPIAATAAEQAAVISGTVSDETGNPHANRVDIVNEEGTFVAGAWSTNGAFSIPSVPPGRYTLRLAYTSGVVTTDDRYPVQYLGGAFALDDAEFFEWNAAESATFDIPIIPGVRLIGALTAPGTTTMKIDWTDDHGNHRSYTVFPAAGRYESYWYPPGSATFSIDAGAQYDVLTLSRNLSPGTEAAVDVTPLPVTGYTGTVTTTVDSPYVYRTGSVKLHPVADPSKTVASASVRSQGTFTATRVPAGEYYVEFVPASGAFAFGKWWPDATTVADAQPLTIAANTMTELALEVRIGGRIHGSTTYHPGSWMTERAPGTVVHVLHRDADGRIAEAPGSPVVSDAEGQWTLPDLLPPGEYTTYVYNDHLGGMYPPQYSCYQLLEQACWFELYAGETKRWNHRIEFTHFVEDRLAGADRYLTAVAVSRAIVADGERAETVYLANGLSFPDALAAGPAAIREGGVILTTAANAMTPAVEAELARLRPQKLRILGGSGVVSDAVLRRAEELTGVTAVRLGGADRWETARQIVRDAFESTGAELVFVATGRNFPDALATGPAAGYLDAPVILVDGLARGIDTATSKLLSDLGTTHVVIVGGAGVVSPAVEAELRRLVGIDHVERLAGTSRWETAGVVNAAVFDGATDALIANGRGFADALVGAPLAGMRRAPLYLSQLECMPETVLYDMNLMGVGRTTLLGGEGVLPTRYGDPRTCSGPYSLHYSDRDIQW